jgi:hypothetical protein
MDIWELKEEDFDRTGDLAFRFVDYNNKWVYIESVKAAIQDAVEWAQDYDMSPIALAEEIADIKEAFATQGKYRIRFDGGTIGYLPNLKRVKKYITYHMCHRYRKNMIGLPNIL